MEPVQGNSCSVIQYYKGTHTGTNNADLTISNSFETPIAVNQQIISENNEDIVEGSEPGDKVSHDDQKEQININPDTKCIKEEETVNEIEKETKSDFKSENETVSESKPEGGKCENVVDNMAVKIESDLEEVKSGAIPDTVKSQNDSGKFEVEKIKSEITKEVVSECVESENQSTQKRKKRKLSEVNNTDNDSEYDLNFSMEEVEANEEDSETGTDLELEEEIENKPRRRGRCKKNQNIIPSHLSTDIVLGYKILLKFLETPQFSGFHKPFKRNPEDEECKITCLNQIKKKFEEDSYKKLCEFVNDVREMLINIYESRNQAAIKKALRLEQILEQRIAQLPNYLRPQCALVLSPEEVNNSHNKIRITKGGGFVSLLLERTEKKRYEKNREKRKLLAEERKQLKEEQDKDVQEWEKNVLLKDVEEEIKSMWELPAIGHFIHLCADILNIGEVAQFEIERMLLMPQCSDTLDLIMTSLLTNTLVRARLDRTPSMPYSIWGPLVKTRVVSWYRSYHKEGRNAQKVFEEVGIEPEFWNILGPDVNPLDHCFFHELKLLQRVWVLKTLCDADFIRKKTVYDNIRAQTLDELNPVHLGLDQQGNRYIQFNQFCGPDIRIYRQSTKLEGDITPTELVESVEGFEHREGPVTTEKVFKDIWELNEKQGNKPRKKKVKTDKSKSYKKVVPEPTEKKNLRRSVRAKQKTYVDWSDSDQSDTDLITLRNKLRNAASETLYRPFSDKEFISLSVFRLPRDKVYKPPSKRSSYTSKKTEDSSKNETSPENKSLKGELEEKKEDIKPIVCEDEQSDSLDLKQLQDIQADLEKAFHGENVNEDEFDVDEKIRSCKLEEVNNDVNFSVKNLENTKSVDIKENSETLKSEEISTDSGNCGVVKTEESETTEDKEYDALCKYDVPDHLKPDSSKFYLVVDSVEGLRQLISKFGSHENDLEIITRSTKSKNKNNSENNTSSEVQLIERLQSLLVELEPWEFDLMKSNRSNKEKMYKEYMNFVNRPPDFVHPNESYWMKPEEEPVLTTSSTTTTTITTTTTTSTTTATTTTSTASADATAVEKNSSNSEKTTVKEGVPNEPSDSNQLDSSTENLMPRKRTRVTRLQLHPDNDLDVDFDDEDDYDESNESDDNWVMPTRRKRVRKESPKIPRRTPAKKSKSSPSNKIESQNTAEKSQHSSPEKAKKALFWGPRSSDPSEDLNWERNRQKILEKHNSPVKKALFTSNNLKEQSELEKALRGENSTSVITASPKHIITKIPGNKKPYFSSAQLKAMESQAKQEGSGIPYGFGNKNGMSKTVRNKGKTPTREISVISTGTKTPVRIQAYGQIKNAIPTQSGVRTIQAIMPKQGEIQVNSESQHLVKFAQINRQINSPVQLNNQIIQSTGGASGGSGIKQVQFQQPISRVQLQSSGKIPLSRTITSTVSGGSQSVQWQPKMINLQTLGSQGKFIQQQIQSQAQVQLSNQSLVSSPTQQVIRLEPQKLPAVQPTMQIPADKMASVQQMIVSQVQSNAGSGNTDNLYITDGKLLIKFDNNFVQQCFQKDKAVSLNIGEKLDLKKPLLIVKPKTEPKVSTSQTPDQSTSQQNVVVINKPQTVQQPNVVSTSVPNYVISGNYIIKDGNQTQQTEQQTVKIVQQAPTYVIQQKPVANKGSQPQIIKIIPSQQMSTNQNLVFNSANMNVTNQVIQPITQTVMTTDQQNKTPSTLRYIRPSNVISASGNVVQNKVNPVQNQIIMNSVVQISGQRMDCAKPQNSSGEGRIVSTAVPAVRMVTPVQTQNVASSIQNNPQTVSLPGNAQILRVGNVHPMRLAAGTQVVVSNPQMVTSSNPQTVRIVTGAPTQTVNSRVVWSTAPINTQTVRLAADQQTHTIIPSSNITSHLVRPASSLTHPIRLASNAQPQYVQAQTVVVSANPNSQNGGTNSQQSKITTSTISAQPQSVIASSNLNTQIMRTVSTVNSQPVRIITSGQQQHIRLIPSNEIRFVNKSVTPVKATVIANTASASNAASNSASSDSKVESAAVSSASNAEPVLFAEEPLGAIDDGEQSTGETDS